MDTPSNIGMRYHLLLPTLHPTLHIHRLTPIIRHRVIEMHFMYIKDLCEARQILCKHLPEVFVGNRSPVELMEDQAAALKAEVSSTGG